MPGNFAHIEGWITPRCEKILRRAIELANEQGYGYLGVEQLVLALGQEPESLPASVWDEPLSLTMEQWQAVITGELPPLKTLEPLTIMIGRDNPPITV